MKIFISWSGPRSRAAARALRRWLPDVIQSVEPWMSEGDIRAGARWTPEINEQLSQAKFGIICLTPSNQHEPWLLFEAGALAKTLKDTFVVPYLIDMEPPDVKGPLSQFQAKRWNKSETLELVRSINKVLGKGALEEERIKRLFARAWPDLEEGFKNPPESESPSDDSQRSSDEILREVLELVRVISRQTLEDHRRSYSNPSLPGLDEWGQEEKRFDEWAVWQEEARIEAEIAQTEPEEAEIEAQIEMHEEAIGEAASEHETDPTE